MMKVIKGGIEIDREISHYEESDMRGVMAGAVYRPVPVLLKGERIERSMDGRIFIFQEQAFDAARKDGDGHG